VKGPRVLDGEMSALNSLRSNCQSSRFPLEVETATAMNEAPATCIQISVLFLMTYMTLILPQFPHLYNGVITIGWLKIKGVLVSPTGDS
jgi:hypothetical protein